KSDLAHEAISVTGSLGSVELRIISMGFSAHDPRDLEWQHMGRGSLGQLLVMGSAPDILGDRVAFLRRTAARQDHSRPKRKKGRAAYDDGFLRGSRLFSLGGRRISNPARRPIRIRLCRKISS